jgi:signal transduction histidine kinase
VRDAETTRVRKAGRAAERRPGWYRSLYWRIGVGFPVFFVLILGVQVAFMVWMVGRFAPPLPGGSWDFAKTVAEDVETHLSRNPGLDLQQHIRLAYPHVPHPFFLLLTDGRLVSSAAGPDAPIQQFMRSELRRRILGIPPPDEPIRPFVGRASIVLDGKVIGLVAVPSRPGLPAVLGRFTPILTMFGLAVLVAGTVLAAALIVRSPRRRLNALQEVTRQIAAGDLSARAPEEARDEIAALARAFNSMAIELRARDDELRAADHARRQLLADMCHELSTPLTAIRGYLETLLMDGVSFDSAARDRYLGIVQQEADRLQRLIADLLDLARLEGGGGILTIEPVSMAQLFDHVVATHASECAKKLITLTTEVQPGARAVLGDPDRLEQVLQNLTANAIRHTRPHGRIDLRAAVRDGALRVTVTDSGEGIPSEHLSRIFDRFYKVSSSRAARSTGSGLGLSIAKAITERHGGTISVASRPGETTFEIILPAPDPKDLPPDLKDDGRAHSDPRQFVLPAER